MREFVLDRAQCRFHEIQTVFRLQALVSGDVRPNQCWIRIVIECSDPAVFSVSVVMVPSTCLAQSDVTVPQQCDELPGCRVVLWNHTLEVREHNVD